MNKDNLTQEDIARLHEQSLKTYPNLEIDNSEYVVRTIKKHPIGRFQPIIISSLVIFMTVIFLIAYPIFLARDFSSPDYILVFLSGFFVIVLAIIFCNIILTIRKNNQFFLTNKSIIIKMQNTPFDKSQKIAGLGDIEDVRYIEKGFLPSLLDFGSIQLTGHGGKGNVSVFYRVVSPRKEARIINSAIEAFREGRPVTGE